jgi:hypothetical protein
VTEVTIQLIFCVLPIAGMTLYGLGQVIAAMNGIADDLNSEHSCYSEVASK